MNRGRGREDTGRYAKAKKARLGRFLKPEHGIPHHDVYLFSLKGSRGTLQEDVKEYFADPGFSAPAGANRHTPFQPVPVHDERHGRIEDRDYAASEEVGWLIERHPDWKTIRSIGVVEPGREARGRRRRNGVFLCPAWRRTRNSLPVRFAGIGGVENPLRYVLDVAFGEDGSRLRKGKGPENMAILRKPALTAERADTGTKSGMIGRRKQMAWPNEYVFIVPGPPVVRYPGAHPSKIVYQLLKEFPAHTPILAWFFDTLNCCSSTTCVLTGVGRGAYTSGNSNPRSHLGPRCSKTLNTKQEALWHNVNFRLR